MRDEGVDIVVTAEGRGLIAVEVKLRGPSDHAVRQLERYMEALSYPVGMVVIGRELVLVRRDFARGTIERVGVYDTSGIELLDPVVADVSPAAGFAFETRVQRWLESLKDGDTVAKLNEPLRSALSEWVLPELEVGQVRATGPRPLAHAV